MIDETNPEEHKDKPFFEPRFELFRFIAALAVAAVGLLIFSGCAREPEAVCRAVYRDVLIPVKCEAPVISCPEWDENLPLLTAEYVDYALALESALRACAQ